MIFAGIDIGKNEHGFAVGKDRDNNFIKPRIIRNDINGFSHVLEVLQACSPDKAEVIIGMESTGHFWRPAAHFFESHGYRVDVFNPIISAKREQQSVRGSKSDKSSAVAIAKVVRDDDYSVCNNRDANSEKLKSLIRQREKLAEYRTDLKNRIIAYWDVMFPELQSHLDTSKLTTLTGLKLLENYACADDIARAHLTKLKNILGRIADDEKIKAIRETAKQSVGLKSKESHQAALSNVRLFRCLHTEIKTIEKQIGNLEDDQTALLRTIPGFGLLASACFQSEIGNLELFRKKSAKPLNRRILAFAGAEPRIRTSGKFTGRIKMSKRGSKHFREALFMAAESARKGSPYFKSIYEKQKNKGKHHRVAISHVIRKMVYIATAMLKNNEKFSIEKLSNFGVETL